MKSDYPENFDGFKGTNKLISFGIYEVLDKFKSISLIPLSYNKNKELKTELKAAILALFSYIPINEDSKESSYYITSRRLVYILSLETQINVEYVKDLFLKFVKEIESEEFYK